MGVHQLHNTPMPAQPPLRRVPTRREALVALKTPVQKLQRWLLIPQSYYVQTQGYRSWLSTTNVVRNLQRQLEINGVS
jgi:hypothetical protein